MNKRELKKTQETIKDLLLFDSHWKKRNKIKNLSRKTIERISIYRGLIKNSFHDVMKNIYPNIKFLLKKDWGNIISEYIEKYPPTSPVLVKIGENFPEYLFWEKNIIKKYPFIVELAQYEWLELFIHDMENEISESNLNPSHTICNFIYPIPKIINKITNNEQIKNIKQEDTSIIIYRDPKNNTVRFFELSQATRTYIEMIKLGFEKVDIAEALSEVYKIPEKEKKQFIKNINGLEKELKKNRILL